MSSSVKGNDCNFFISYANYSKHLRSNEHLKNINSDNNMLNVSTFSLNNQIRSDKYLLNSLRNDNFQLTKEWDSYKVKYKELLIKFNKLNNEKIKVLSLRI